MESGSTAIATKVISGDQIVIAFGGGHGALAVSATIGAHGDQSVAIGGTALDTTLFGEADIQSGGTAIGMTVKSGGLLLVDDGGTASGVVSSGGTLALFGSNPSVAGVTLLTGATLELGGGHVGSGDVSRGFPERVVNGGTQAGGAILSGGRVDVLFLGIVSGTTVSSGGKIVVSNAGQAIDVTINHGGSGIVSAGGMFLADAGGTAEIDGRLTLNTAGELFASSTGGLIDIASGGFVSGGSAVIGDGTVAIHASGNTEKVVFEPDGSGGLILDDRAGHATAYAGRVSGFGGVSHTNTSQFIDLELVTFSAGKIGSSYTPVNASSGTLTVTSGGTVVAKIAFAGQYVGFGFSRYLRRHRPRPDHRSGRAVRRRRDARLRGGRQPARRHLTDHARHRGDRGAVRPLHRRQPRRRGRRAWRRPHGRGRSISRPAPAFDAASRLTRANKPQRKLRSQPHEGRYGARSRNSASCVAMVAVLPGIA